MLLTRRAIVTVITLLLTLAIGVIIAWVSYLHYPVVRDDKGIQFIVKEGSSYRTVFNELQKRNIIPFAFILSMPHRLQKSYVLKAGEYFFPKNSTPSSILHQINTGTGLVYYVFTIVPGWNFKQIRDALERERHVQHTIRLMSDHKVMSLLGQVNVSPEGQFYPESYYFANGSSDIKILKKAHNLLNDKLNHVWEQRTQNLPYKNAYEVLIAASLIEKEAHFEIDKPIIAGVILNRLHRKMLLQIDPTVIYGMGVRYEGKLRRQDLLIDTPYNTYLHKGLPPTPIAMSTISSLNAVVHPQINNYLYYVARSDGYHQFSSTLQQHHEAVAMVKQFHTIDFFNEALIKKYLVKLIIN